MEVRFLKADEFNRLDEIPEADKLPLDPASSLVAVAIDESGKIVGRLAALSLPHIDCLWIGEEVRGGLILRQLEKLVVEELKQRGAKLAIAYAVNGKMESYVHRLGYDIMATAWKKEL